MEADAIAAESSRPKRRSRAAEGNRGGEEASSTEELADVEAALAEATAARDALVAQLEPRLVALFEQVAKARKGVAICAGHARRPLLGLPRPAAPAGVPAGPAQRQHHPVRQLPADPLLRAAARPRSNRPRRHASPDVNQPSLFGAAAAAASAIANIDGGSRGNPGPAGYGVRIERDDGTVVELKESIGVATNNVAEYTRPARRAALGGRATASTTLHVRVGFRAAGASRCAASTA